LSDGIVESQVQPVSLVQSLFVIKQLTILVYLCYCYLAI